MQHTSRLLGGESGAMGNFRGETKGEACSSSGSGEERGDKEQAISSQVKQGLQMVGMKVAAVCSLYHTPGRSSAERS